MSPFAYALSTRKELSAASKRGAAWLALPFDAARALYAASIQAGFLPRSILAARDVERALDSAERWMLGPLARRV